VFSLEKLPNAKNAKKKTLKKGLIKNSIRKDTRIEDHL